MNREERRRFGREHGIPMPPAQPQQVGLPFQPLPVATSVGTAETLEQDEQGGTRRAPRVWVQIQTPFGVNGIMLSPEHAERLASELALGARTARSGLLVAGNGALTPVAVPESGPDDEEPALGERPPLAELEQTIGLDRDEEPLEHDEGIFGGEGGPGGGA